VRIVDKNVDDVQTAVRPEDHPANASAVFADGSVD
jgi:hypothetical protein